MKRPVFDVENIKAVDVARIFGVKTATLAYWRRQGKGPKGWFYVGETVVVYPLAEVEAFMAERTARREALLALAQEKGERLRDFARRRKALNEETAA